MQWFDRLGLRVSEGVCDACRLERPDEEMLQTRCLVFDCEDRLYCLCDKHLAVIVDQVAQSYRVASGPYCHKTGTYYVLDPGPRGAAIDSTNGPDEGKRMVVYRSSGDGQLYVRQESQFAEPGRFTRRE